MQQQFKIQNQITIINKNLANRMHIMHMKYKKYKQNIFIKKLCNNAVCPYFQEVVA